MAESKQLLIDFDRDRRSPLLSVSEIFDSLDESLLRSIGEDRRLERKPPTIHCKELGEYISMWANTGPEGGLIVIGISDKGDFIGLCSQGAARLNDLEKAHVIYASDAKVDSRRVEVISKDGCTDFILVLHVHFDPTTVVFHSGGNAYIRVSDTKKKLSPEEILELRSDRGEIAREQCATSLEWPDDFDLDAIEKFCAAIKATHTLEEEHSDEEMLAQRRLGKIRKGQFRPNIACALIFANDPQSEIPGSKVHVLRFSGTEELTGSQRNVVKEQWFEGPLPTLIRDTANFVSSQLKEFSALGADGKFYSDPEYPPDAWYEAIVNAAVHRSYGLKNAEITIRMFDDRLIVESPGGFPPTVSARNIYSTRYPRNPHLMDALLYFRYVKCSNEGAKRMKREMLSHNLPEPEFDEIEAAFCKVTVTLRNNIKNRQPWLASDVLQKAHLALYATLSEQERKIILFVSANKEINISQASREGGCSWKRAKTLLLRLVTRGLLDHKIRKNRGRTRDVDTQASFVLKSGS